MNTGFPSALTHSLTGPGPVGDHSGITLRSIGADVFHYTLIPLSGSAATAPDMSLARRMDLFLGETHLAALDFNAPYEGKPFSITHNGVEYEGNFFHGEIDFKPSLAWSR
ncbi:hypothetical protein [Hymenobacter sediminicola]|uniref:Uncharacterized protein n=1 Tax=Hymenobacter sediminicola TaxID=2761579 RepID=A0A7G7W759_9BACT|nr:hypothetical protein [Hymenobacter sediminicola]QNH62202.1 hypothetical protein H4317_19030 [Hymenobacter sediminicola]